MTNVGFALLRLPQRKAPPYTSASLALCLPQRKAPPYTSASLMLRLPQRKAPPSLRSGDSSRCERMDRIGWQCWTGELCRRERG